MDVHVREQRCMRFRDDTVWMFDDRPACPARQPAAVLASVPVLTIAGTAAGPGRRAID